MVEQLQMLHTRSDFRGADILDEAQFSDTGVGVLFEEARAAREFIGNVRQLDILSGTIVAAHFEAASTRTRGSYEAGAKRLGAEVIVADNMESSSRSKGEKITHTARTYERLTANAIVARTKKTGDAAKMAEAVTVPVHNAGDGSGKHPTQAALDLFTILEDSEGSVHGKRLSIVRDALHGRTAHSLAPLAAKFGMEVTVVTHPALRMPDHTVRECAEFGIEVVQTEDLEGTLKETDYLYVTRLQRERFKGWSEKRLYNKLNGKYVISPDLLDEYGADNLKVMHPLPADGELTDAMDTDPRNLCWLQMENGVFIRQGLLALTLGKSITEYVHENHLTPLGQVAELPLAA